MSARKVAAPEKGAPFSPGNGAGISRILAPSEMKRPFSPDGFDRSPRNRARTSSGDAMPTRKRSFRPGGARRSAKRARPRVIRSTPTSRIARHTTFMSRLTVITARFLDRRVALLSITARPPTVTGALPEEKGGPTPIRRRPRGSVALYPRAERVSRASGARGRPGLSTRKAAKMDPSR